MQKVNTIMAHLRFAMSSRMLVISTLLALTGWVIVFNALFLPSGLSANNLNHDCTASAIMCDGAWDSTKGMHTIDKFVERFNADAPGDLHTIYKAYGLDNIDTFKSNAQVGTIDNKGSLWVNNKQVATNLYTIGRTQQATGGYKTTAKTIGGKTYYEESLVDLMKVYKTYGDDTTTAYVQMNGDTPKFAVMTACGNPLTFTQPSYKCEMLNASLQSGTTDTYDFTTNVTATGGATLSKVVYNFGDGSAEVTQTSATTKVTHQYAQSATTATYNARVTAYFTVNGSSTTVTSDCVHQITIPPKTTTTTATYECSDLAPALIENTYYTYKFTATAAVTGDATLIDASFDYGDGKTDSNVAASNNQVTTQHAYDSTSGKTYIASITKMRFKTNGTTVEVNGNTNGTNKCQASITTPSSSTPVYLCTGLESGLDTKAETALTYHITVSADARNGATLTSADFSFGDNTSATGIKPTSSSSNSITTTHDYPNDTKDYTVTATLNFTVVSQGTTTTKSVTCSDKLSTTKYTPSTTNSIPSTGPGDLVGTAFGFSGIVAAGGYYLRSRKDLVASILKR